MALKCTFQARKHTFELRNPFWILLANGDDLQSQVIESLTRASTRPPTARAAEPESLGNAKEQIL